MGTPTITLVMPTISWEAPFTCCAQSALAGLAPGDEALIVFDGSPPPAPEWLIRTGMAPLATGIRSGPAAARNLAARAARAEVLVFVDADVELHQDALGRVRSHFRADRHLDAVFGSYDDRPVAPGVVSQFRNLLHHYIHTSHPGPVGSFWAGCGAVRRDRFLGLGGFDAVAYDRPCIEDIEFGLRLALSGGKILLDPTIQCTHYKRWTLRSMVVTDILHRAIPWSRLLQRHQRLPATLNLNLPARMSGLLSVGLATTLMLMPLLSQGNHRESLRTLALAFASSCGLALLLLNRNFYAYLVKLRGFRFALIAIPLHWLYFVYSTLSFLLVLIYDSVYCST
jgi:GT2 family glycosyltransferase